MLKVRVATLMQIMQPRSSSPSKNSRPPSGTEDEPKEIFKDYKSVEVEKKSQSTFWRIYKRNYYQLRSTWNQVHPRQQSPMNNSRQQWRGANKPHCCPAKSQMVACFGGGGQDSSMIPSCDIPLPPNWKPTLASWKDLEPQANFVSDTMNQSDPHIPTPIIEMLKEELKTRNF